MQLFIRKCFWSGTVTLIISNKEMDDIVKIVKSLAESGLLINSVSKTNKNEAKDEEMKKFLGMLLDILDTSLLGDILTGKDTIRAGESTIRAFQEF